MASDLLIVVPVRRRPKLLERFIDSFDATREFADLLILTDDDDYGQYMDISLPSYSTMIIMPRMSVCPKVNAYAVPASSKYPFVGNTGDDNLMTTPGWDRLLCKAIEDKPGWAYPDDQRRTDVPENVVISSIITRTLGWFQEPSMDHYYVDNIWADLGNALGRLFFVPEVIQPHLHYHVTGGERDDTYREAEERGHGDQAAYLRWKQYRMAADVELLRGVL